MAQRLLDEIPCAKDAVAAAEGAIERLMSELEAVVRAEKTTISEVLSDAFDKLRAARAHLVTLEELARPEAVSGAGQCCTAVADGTSAIGTTRTRP